MVEQKKKKKELYQHWIFVRKKKNFLNLLFWVRNSMNFKSVFCCCRFSTCSFYVKVTTEINVEALSLFI